MSKAPAFQFYAQDFLTGVMYLTNEEIGIYIKMLAKQWTDGQIPKKRLGLLVGLEWDSFSQELKNKFKDCGEHLINIRLEEERIKKEKFIEKQSKNGKKGGRPAKKSKKENPIKTQIQTQKKPLEEEDEIEVEVEKVKKKKEKVERPDVIFPFDNENFRTQWQHWKVYKDKELKFKYKTIQSEQAALNELANKSQGDEKTAIAIMHQSMANGWKGFFTLKNEQHGKSKKQYIPSDNIKRRIAEKMAGGKDN